VTKGTNEHHRGHSKNSEARWARVLAREVTANFVYAVHTTGVYCRPSCPSRRPLQKNVEFFDTGIAAELAGFRACKRCKPQMGTVNSEVQRVLAMCRFLEDSQDGPSLQQLATHVSLSESHAHRCFVKTIGLTPQNYLEAVLRRRVQQALPASRRVTDVI
jgi:AraC family transcriptional regulator of adaptative response/methylated-DNA-[protein]-cysteine methyltransferase